MNNKFFSLLNLEIKKAIFLNSNILFNFIFFLVNMLIFPLALEANNKHLQEIFVAVLITSISLGSYLITQQSFKEDFYSGKLDLLKSFGIKIEQIYTAKLIAFSLQFSLILLFAIPIAGFYYQISLLKSLKIIMVIIPAIPSLISISIFSSLMMLNSAKNSSLSIIIIFPLLLTILILVGIAANTIIKSNILGLAIPFIQVYIGISILLIVAKYFLSKILD